MIVAENVTVYKCEHCGKKLFRKYAMANHEAKCNSNPINIPACYGCQFLEQIETTYEKMCNSFGEDYGVRFDSHSETVKTNGFRCVKLDKELYPPKVLIKGIIDKYPESFENKELMPNDCDHFKNMGIYGDWAFMDSK